MGFHVLGGCARAVRARPKVPYAGQVPLAATAPGTGRTRALLALLVAVLQVTFPFTARSSGGVT
ncbi:hypothetical protein Ssi03_63340 [Sphaerisporangium siamense]|nr:hypothetical protein Ssi03_63340 [Sphaerisporangium siamense]